MEMAEQRRKGRQINFRIPDELAERFEEHCQRRHINMTQFLENSIRQALGEALTIPQDALGGSEATKAVKASDVEGLEEKVRDIVRDELAKTLGQPHF
jgi:hypothetical protein